VDSLYVLVAFMVGLSVFGFGYWVGMNKTNQEWQRRMAALERKLRRTDYR
jgi:hypothetical protein